MDIKVKKEQVLVVIFLGMLTALAPLSVDMYLPALPLMISEYGIRASLAQLTLTATMVGMGMGQVFAGPISDLKGRKQPLFFGLLIFAISTFSCIFATSIWMFLACRFIQGLAGSAGLVIARAIARDICEGPELMRFFSMLMLVNGLAPVFAPVIGGQILLFTSWRGIFVFLGSIGLILTFFAFVFKETLPLEERISGVKLSFMNFDKLIRNRYFLGHCLVQCFSFASFFAYIAGSSFVFQNIYGVSAQIYSLIFGGLGLVIMFGGIINGYLAGRMPLILILKWSLFQAFLGSFFILICFMIKASMIFVLIGLIFTVPTISIISATSFSLAMKEHSKHAGSASALIGFFSMISGGFMAPLVGVAGSSSSIPMGVAMVIGAAGAIVFFYYMIKK